VPEHPFFKLLGKVRTRLSWWLRRDPVFYARVRELLARRSLPPGDLVRLDHLEFARHEFLLERAGDLGPVFKGIAWGRLCICVVGLDPCRRFLQGHHTDLRAMKMHLGEFIPGGFVCAREGKEHRALRRSLQQAVQETATAVASPGLDAVFEAIAAEGLHAYAAAAVTHGHGADAYRETLLTIATSMLIRNSFGCEPCSAEHRRLLELYRGLSTEDVVWDPGSREARAFHALHDEVLSPSEAIAVAPEGAKVTSLLERCRAHGTLDEAMLGTLLYQLETGRHDMKNLLRWLTLHGGDHPRVMERITLEGQAGGADDRVARAMVLETLRHDQTERLMREVLKDFVFDGYLIPRHATVRLCLWESHRDPDSFADPLDFDPERFLLEAPRRESFAPFGLDHHQCPMDGMVVRMGISFLRALSGYRITSINPGPASRGRFHWEPPVDFSVQLQPH